MTRNKILVFGDSITYGQRDLEMGGWVNRLKLALAHDDSITSCHVFNMGISGQNTTEVLERMERECAEKKCDYRGALAYMPKRARIFAFFTLVALGLPISAMFWNNFIIISSLFRFSFLIGVMVMTAIGLISVSMLYELYVMRDLKSHIDNEREITDISRESLLFFTVVIVVIILSFFNPLWFVV